MVLAAGDYASAVCVHPPYKATPQAAFRRRNKVAFAKKMLRKLAFFPHTMEKVLTSSFALSKKLLFAEFCCRAVRGVKSVNGVSPNYIPNKV